MIKTFFEMHKLDDPTGREDYLKPSDIYNIRAKYNIWPGRFHKIDMQSVEQLLNQEKDGENWKWSVDESGKGFRLGIMTKGQLNLLKKHGDKGIALDGTHCTTKYNMKLITMLVLDDHQTGRPVAFFFCHEEAQQDLMAFFQGVVAK